MRTKLLLFCGNNNVDLNHKRVISPRVSAILYKAPHCLYYNVLGNITQALSYYSSLKNEKILLGATSCWWKVQISICDIHYDNNRHLCVLSPTSPSTFTRYCIGMEKRGSFFNSYLTFISYLKLQNCIFYQFYFYC